LLGNPVWTDLTKRQRDLLRTTVRDHFAQALAPVGGAPTEIAWAWVEPSDARPIAVSLGLRYGSAVLKTRWDLQHSPRGWAIEDVELVDPGISLAAESDRIIGPHPVRPRDRAREARDRALPRLLAMAAILGAALVFSRRVPPERRLVLWLTASVPAALFAVDGALAARRALSERYALIESPPAQPWRAFEQSAMEAQRQGDEQASRRDWEKAIAAGARPAPAFFQMGLSARSRGDLAQARSDFERALSERPPAPGAGRELALMAAAGRREDEARRLLETYLRETGPDPESLATLAVIDANAGDSEGAVRAIEEARSLLGEAWKGAELEAQVYARSGDAARAVAALRPLEAQGRLDRSTLRADPAYLKIATEPDWVRFLAETPSAPTVTPAPK
jgi:tetratricopeptide (TPR) repeat protein